MKPFFKRVPACLNTAFLSLLAASAASAQPAQPSDKAKDDIVELSPFTVSTAATGRYTATETTSGARVRISLMDSTQHVSVVTRDLMDDIGMGRLLDAAKYVAGVTEATIPNAQDRTNLRGFQVDGVTIDGFGFNSFSFGNLDPVLADRLEIVKGPNAILAPTGQPGGTENIVSKRPLFRNQGYTSAQVGRYSSTRAEFDVNRVVTAGKLAVRVVGAAQKSDDYPGDNFHRSMVVMPEFTYRFSPSTQVTAEVEISDFRVLNYLGIPLDPYVGTNDSAMLIRGVSRTLLPIDQDTVRYQKMIRSRTFFTTNFTDQLSMRVAGNFVTSHGSSAQSNLSGSNPTTVDPATGISVVSPTATVTRTYTRSFGYGDQVRRNLDIQNDFAYHLKTDVVDATTVVGWWAAYSLEYNKNLGATKPPFSIDAYTSDPGTFTGVNGLGANTRRVRQAYASETLTFLDGRVIASGGIARASYQNHVNDKFRDLRAANNPSATLPSYGVVVRPVPQVSLFYGFSKQSTGIDPSVTSVIPFTLQTSRQNEYGVRLQLLDKRLYASISHFDIKQNNFSVPNPGNLTVPPPIPALPPLYMDRKAKGWEYELTAALTQSWSVIGNYSDYTNRNPYGQVFRGIAEKSGAVWSSYSFKTGELKGLTAGIGVEYLDRRPGDSPPGTLTSASTPTNLIIVQPTFWLPSRTLVNASLVYSWGTQWKAQLNIDNLTNKQYIAASINRFMITPGTPINPRLTVTYKF